MHSTPPPRGVWGHAPPGNVWILGPLRLILMQCMTLKSLIFTCKLIKTRLRNRLSDVNLARLMRIAIEGPELTSVNFDEVLEIFKEKNRRIQL